LEEQEPSPSSNTPSANETSEAAADADDIVVFEDLDHNAMEMETITAVVEGHGQELREAESLSNASLEHITKEIDEFYSLCEEMDVQPLEDGWIMDGSNFEVPSSPQPTPPGNLADGSRATSFMAWTRSSQSCSDEAVAAVPVIEEPQKLLKKVVAGGGAWANCGGGGVGTSTTGAAQESGVKNHVMSERKRREKLNEMFLILKSLVPSIHKVLKISGFHQFLILPWFI